MTDPTTNTPTSDSTDGIQTMNHPVLLLHFAFQIHPKNEFDVIFNVIFE
jgi:hypothetical protein